MKTKSQPTAPPAAAEQPAPVIHIADLVLEETLNREENPIVFTGSARQYRADCQAGQFKIGASQLVGSKLNLELIGARLVEGQFFGYRYQKWLNLIFVDPDGVVSSILLKTESMDNLLEVHRQALAANDIVLGKAIQARMSKRTSRENGESYYAVEFEMIGPGAYSDAIARFRQENAVAGIYRALSPPERDADANANANAA